MDVNEDNKISEHVSDSVIGKKFTNIVRTSETIELNECNLDSPSPVLKNTIYHLRNLSYLKGKDLASRKALWPADDTNLENSNNSEDGKILTRNVEHNVSIDEMSSNSEPYAESSDEEYKPESTSDSDKQAVNVDLIKIAKTRKLLMAASQDRILENQGRTLDQINVNLIDIQYENTNNTVTQTTGEVSTDNEPEHITRNANELVINKDCLYDESTSNNKEMKNVIDNNEPSSKNRVARSKVRWNTPEKDRLRRRFKGHLKTFKVPGKLEC